MARNYLMMRSRNSKDLEEVDFEDIAKQLKHAAIDEELCVEVDGQCYYDRNVYLHVIIIVACVSHDVANDIANAMIEVGLFEIAQDKGDTLLRMK